MGHYELHSWIVLTLDGYSFPSICAARSSPCRNSWSAGTTRRRVLALSIVQLLSYVIAKASVTIYRRRVVFNSFLGVDSGQGDWLIAVTGAYPVFGGFMPSCTPRHCKPLRSRFHHSDHLGFMKSAAGKPGQFGAQGSPEHVPPLSNPDFRGWGSCLPLHRRHLYWSPIRHRAALSRGPQRAASPAGNHLRCLPQDASLLRLPDSRIDGDMRFAFGQIQTPPVRSGIPNLGQDSACRSACAACSRAASWPPLMSSLASVYNACSTSSPGHLSEDSAEHDGEGTGQGRAHATASVVFSERCGFPS